MYHNADPKPMRKPKEPKPLKRTPLKRAYKPTGEAFVFADIAIKRAPICEVCGKRIAKLRHTNFAHVLSKGAFPRFRLSMKNILIMCFNTQGTGCHSLFDNEAESVLIKRNPEQWKPIFELKQVLKTEYNKPSFLLASHEKE